MQNPFQSFILFFAIQLLATGAFVFLMTAGTLAPSQITYATVSFILFTFLSVGYMIYQIMFKHKVIRNRLRKTGIAASATILTATETGMRINERPVVKIEVEINDRFSGNFTATLYKTVGIFGAQHLTPGNKINVLFNPNNRKEVVIDE